MEWFQVLAIILSITGIVFWFQRENKADMRVFQTEISNDIKNIQKDMKEFRELWAKEIKDFHGRLCAIEERRK